MFYIYSFVCMWGGECMCASTCMWGSEDNKWNSVTSFCHVNLRVQTQFIRLGDILLALGSEAYLVALAHQMFRL